MGLNGVNGKPNPLVDLADAIVRHPEFWAHMAGSLEHHHRTATVGLLNGEQHRQLVKQIAIEVLLELRRYHKADIGQVVMGFVPTQNRVWLDHGRLKVTGPPFPEFLRRIWAEQKENVIAYLRLTGRNTNTAQR